MDSDQDQSFIDDYRQLNADSKAFMRHVMRRVVGIGLKTYGPWSAANDSRNLPREIGDELFDATVYAGMLAVKQDRERQQREHSNHLVVDDRCVQCDVNAFEDEPANAKRIADAEANKKRGTLPEPSSSFDVRENEDGVLEAHEILMAKCGAV